MKALFTVRKLPYWLRLTIALGVIVAPTLALSVLVAQDGYRNTEDLAVSQAQHDAMLVDLYLRTYLDKYFGILKTLAVERARGRSAGSSTTDNPRALLERVALDHPRVGALIAIDDAGKIIASSRPEALGLNLSGDTWWNQLANSHIPVVSDFEDLPPLGGPIVVLAVPVPDSGEAVALSLNTSTMSTVWEGLSSAGTILLVDRQGIPIVQSNRRYLSSAERSELAADAAVLPAVRQSTGIATFRNVSNFAGARNAIGAGLVDPDYGWSVIAIQDRETVLGPVLQTMLRTWIMLAASVFASFIIAVILIGHGSMRRVVLPEISIDGGKSGLDKVFDHIRQQVDDGLYGEVSLKFRGGHIYKAVISRERVFD